MFQLDDNFLKDLGLDGLPAEQKAAFLQHIYEELELRVGTRLAEGLNDAQLSEFESLIERDGDKVQDWLAKNVPDYQTQPDYQKILQQLKDQNPNPIVVLSEYAATKWLEINRPDYRAVVAEVLDELKKEITANRDNILG